MEQEGRETVGRRRMSLWQRCTTCASARGAHPEEEQAYHSGQEWEWGWGWVGVHSASLPAN